MVWNSKKIGHNFRICTFLNSYIYVMFCIIRPCNSQVTVFDKGREGLTWFALVCQSRRNGPILDRTTWNLKCRIRKLNFGYLRILHFKFCCLVFAICCGTFERFHYYLRCLFSGLVYTLAFMHWPVLFLHSTWTWFPSCKWLEKQVTEEVRQNVRFGDVTASVYRHLTQVNLSSSPWRSEHTSQNEAAPIWEELR